MALDKNPVYHVGKLYNVAAGRIAAALHCRFGGHVEVHLVSVTGQPLLRPWKVLVRMTRRRVLRADVLRVVTSVVDRLPELTEEIVTHGLRLA